MKRNFRVSPKSKKSVSASRRIGNTKRENRVSGVRASRALGRQRTVTACQIMQDINQYQPWSGAVDTYNNLLEFGCWDAFVDFLDTEYYDENAGEGVISETLLNDLLWFEPAFCYEAVGLYYNDDTGEVSDEPFDEDDYDDVESATMVSKYTKQQVIDAIMQMYGYNKAQANKYYRDADEATKEALVEAYRGDARKSFYND